MSGSNRRPALPGQYSTFIHGWRLLATAAVFLGHATRPDILFDIDCTLIGRATIPTFLIISGYFTAMSFSGGGHFLSKVGNRYFQLYVFFVPATLLVFAMDLYMLRVGGPFLLADKFDPDMSASRILIDVFNLFTFSGEYWSVTTIGQGVFSNMAIWTIDYIMAYVVMTGALYLLRGRARIAVLLTACVISGPTVMLLAPLWFTGVLAYNVNQWFGLPDAHHARWLGLSARTLKWGALVAVGLAVATWVAIEVLGIGESVYRWSKTLASYELRQYLGMAKRFLWQWCYIPILFVIIVGARFIFDGPVKESTARRAKAVSRYALPVYAIHFTTMYFIQSLFPYYTPRHDSLDPYLMIGLTLVLSIGFGYIIFTWVKPVADSWQRRITNVSNRWCRRARAFGGPARVSLLT